MSQRDVYASLAELQDKLQQLQRELSGSGPAEHAAPAEDPGAPAGEPLRSMAVSPRADAPDPIRQAKRAFDDAVATLDRQIAALADLRERLDRAGREIAEAAEAPTEYRGQVSLNAGPFPDIPTLGDFERALQRIPGTEDVHVAGFEGDRALIDLRLGLPVRLIDELQRALPYRFRVRRAEPAAIVVDLET